MIATRSRTVSAPSANRSFRSVALPTQLKQVLEVAERLKDQPEAPRHLLLGGPGVRHGLDLDPAYGITVCRDLAEARALLVDNHRP